MVVRCPQCQSIEVGFLEQDDAKRQCRTCGHAFNVPDDSWQVEPIEYVVLPPIRGIVGRYVHEGD